MHGGLKFYDFSAQQSHFENGRYKKAARCVAEAPGPGLGCLCGVFVVFFFRDQLQAVEARSV